MHIVTRDIDRRPKTSLPSMLLIDRQQRPGSVLPPRPSVYAAPGASRSRHASQSDDWKPACADASAALQSVRSGGAGGAGMAGGGGVGGGGDGGIPAVTRSSPAIEPWLEHRRLKG